MSFHQRTNSFLAAWVSVINALVAVGIPVVLAFSSGGLAGSAGEGFSLVGFVAGFIGGALMGVFVAGPLCGVLAVLIDIRNTLAAQQPRRSQDGGTP